MKQDNINIENKRVDRGWDKMHSTLDVKMPQKKDRKKFFWLLFGLGLMIIIPSLFLWINSHSTTNNVAIKIDTTSDKIQSTLSEKSRESKASDVTKKPDRIVTNASDILTSDKANEKAPIRNSLLTQNNAKQKTKRVRIIEVNDNSGKEKSSKNNSLSSSNTNIAVNDILEKFSKKQPDSETVSNSEINNKLRSTSTTIVTEHLALFVTPIRTIPFSDLILTSQDNVTELYKPQTSKAVIELVQPSPWGFGAYTSISADYLHKINSFGTTISAGALVNRNKFSFGPNISYTLTNPKSSISDIFIQSSETNDVRLADDLNNNEVNVAAGLNASADSLFIDDLTVKNNIRYISVGLNALYNLDSKWAFLFGIGNEFHFGTQALVSVNPVAAMGFEQVDKIELKHRNNLYLESGISYGITDKFSLVARYRYVTSSLINIINDSRGSTKVSLAMRYNF